MSEPTLFIPSAVDDFGMSAAEYRVCCHIARRGDCYAAINTISEVCRLEPKTVRRALSTLSKHLIASKEERIGRTTIYRLNPISKWIPLPKGTKGAEREHTPTKRRKGVLPKGTRGPLPKGTSLRFPPEVPPAKGSPSECAIVSDNGHAPSGEGKVEHLYGMHTGGPDIYRWLKAAKKIGYAHIFGGELEAVHAWFSACAVNWVDSSGKKIWSWRGWLKVCRDNSEGRPIQSKEGIERAFEIQLRLVAMQFETEILWHHHREEIMAMTLGPALTHYEALGAERAQLSEELNQLACQ